MSAPLRPLRVVASSAIASSRFVFPLAFGPVIT